MEERANILRAMQICRFCLDEKGPLTNIYAKNNTRDGNGKNAIPLPLQIMACIAIEAFENDLMPQFICNNCSTQTIIAYNFKTTCKKSDDALKLYLATGNLIKPKPPRTSETTQQQQPVESGKREAPFAVEQQNAAKRSKNPEEAQVTEEEEVHEELEYIEGIDYANDSSQDSQDSQEQYTEVFLDDNPINQILKVPQVETDVFPCTRCERSFPLKQLLDLHIKNHDRERSFSCDICKRKFFTKYDLAKHIQTHTIGKPFECIVCLRTFGRESLLHRHQKVHVDAPKYLCTECDKTFLTAEDLDVHSEKHKKKRPFSCRICNKSFVFKQGLERHESTHSEEKLHKCNYCEASFTSPLKLMRHITSHAGLRPYPCKLCGRTFLLSHHLTRHMRSHYATKSAAVEPVGQHKCDVCSMSFRRKDSLINHSAIHSMVNLKCVICNTSFSNAKDVKEHITTHLAGLPYPCDKCDYSFATQDHLEEHELKHAEMEYEEQIEQEICEEAKNKDDEAENDGSEDGYEGHIQEYTITNDADDNPQVVRRRPQKIKNYAQFLKDELGSDVENEIVLEQSVIEEEHGEDDIPEVIKPIVRSEGTKVYSRKPSNKKLPEIQTTPESVQDTSMSLENLGLTHEFVKDLPNEQYIDMKIGDIIYKVKKVTMKKTEFDAVAKQENVESKGGILVKKTIKGSRFQTKNITIENIIDDPKPTPVKHIITKTYVKKTPSSQSASQISRKEGVLSQKNEIQSQPQQDSTQEILGDAILL